MKKYYAAITKDGSGPAFGIGTTPEEALQDAVKWDAETPELKTIEVTRESYEAIEAGAPYIVEEAEMTLADAKKRLDRMGLDYVEFNDHIHVSVDAEGCDEYITELRESLPGLQVEFAGSSNTDSEGYTSEDIRIWKE